MKNNKVAVLNDHYRNLLTSRTYAPKFRFMLAASVSHLPSEDLASLIKEVALFSDFTKDNDPHKEHDFGKIEFNGVDYFWKFDYYDEDLEYGLDPLDEKCVRVLTLMEASDY